MQVQPDITTTRYILPPDAKLLTVDELAPRTREKLGPVDAEQVVVTRPGYRITTRLITPSLAALLSEFRSESLITDAILRFSKSNNQDAFNILDISFDALATCIEGKTLVASDSVEAKAVEPSFAAGQAVEGMEIESLVRSLDDTEVYRVRLESGDLAALKIARDGRAEVMLTDEAKILKRLDGKDCPAFIQEGVYEKRKWLAMEWCDGVNIATVAQQLRVSGDRKKLHTLVTELIFVYSRLHKRGVVHGDIHTGNVLVDNLGKITIIDFGRARLISDTSAVDLHRAGIAYYYDPQMALMLLEKKFPPAASTVSEQYALGTLVYLLLTGLYPFRPASEQEKLLKRIVYSPVLPFTHRGVDGWPHIEEVLRRALAKEEKNRFKSTGEFAKALQGVKLNQQLSQPSKGSLQKIASLLKGGEAENFVIAKPHHMAWLNLRGALLLQDTELLSLADIWSTRSGNSFEELQVASAVAYARLDHKAEREVVLQCLSTIHGGGNISDSGALLLHIATLLEGIGVPFSEYSQHIGKIHWLLSKFEKTDPGQEKWLYVNLQLYKAGLISLPKNINDQLDCLESDNFNFWSLAYEVLQQPAYLVKSMCCNWSSDASTRVLAYLRLHRLTGESQWISAATRIVKHHTYDVSLYIDALLNIEIGMAARSKEPPFALDNNLKLSG